MADIPFIARGFRGRRTAAAPGCLPPGQYETRDFPVLPAGPTPHTPHTPLTRWEAIMQTEDMRLDGDSEAGRPREIFARDVTTALATCIACGKVAAFGQLLDYAHGMGVVLRCPACEASILRFVHTPDGFHLDFSGLSFMTIPNAIS